MVAAAAPTTEFLRTAQGYRATQMADGTLVVHDVPIFCTCERVQVIGGEKTTLVFDEKWIRAAFAKAKSHEAEGYLPPLHGYHHDDGKEVKPAGFFRITRVGSVTLHGEKRPALIADLVFTDPNAREDVLAKKTPYLSVEIFKVLGPPKIDSLALLSDEAPFLEMPLLLVGNVDKQESALAFASLRQYASSERMPVLAFRQRGERAALLFRNGETAMADESKSDEKKDDEKGEGTKMEAAALDITAIVKAIEDKSISVAQMEEIQAAIAKAMATKADPAEEEVKEAPEAAVPGAAMKAGADNDLAIKFARMQGELESTKNALGAIQAEAARTRDVAAAMKRLDGRPMGSDLEARLTKFHAEYGASAFKAYVDGLDTCAPNPLTGDDSSAAFGANANGQGGKLTEAVAAYMKSANPGDVDLAAKFSREYHDLKSAGVSIGTEADYIRTNMQRREAALAARQARA